MKARKENLQYVEIFNRRTSSMDLSQWAFTRDIQSFHEQVVNRRKFILAELGNAKR